MERPVVAEDQAIQSGGGESYALRMCHVDNALSGLWQPGCRPLQAAIMPYRLSAQGSYRV